MIKINVQSEDILKKNKLIADFVNAHRAKSFGDRNPHLGKMQNCHVCHTRHRSSVHCEATYATHDRHGNPYYEDGTQMIAPLPDQTPVTPTMQRNAVMGRAQFAKKRWMPHRHPRTLEFLYLANMFFDHQVSNNKRKDNGQPLSYQPDMTRCVRAVIAIVQARIDRKKSRARRQSDLSRRINAGLAIPGSR